MADSPSTSKLKNYIDFRFTLIKVFPERSKLGLDSNCIKLRKHISKSTSELSYHESCPDMSEKQSPKRVKSAGTAAGVLQKTHGFFSTLRVR